MSYKPLLSEKDELSKNELKGLVENKVTSSQKAELKKVRVEQTLAKRLRLAKCLDLSPHLMFACLFYADMAGLYLVFVPLHPMSASDIMETGTLWTIFLTPSHPLCTAVKEGGGLLEMLS